MSQHPSLPTELGRRGWCGWVWGAWGGHPDEQAPGSGLTQGMWGSHPDTRDCILDVPSLVLNPLRLCVRPGRIDNRCGNEWMLNPGPSPRVSTSGVLVITTVGGGLFSKGKVKFLRPVLIRTWSIASF